MNCSLHNRRTSIYETSMNMSSQSSRKMHNLKKGFWSPDEDERLIHHVMKHGQSCWRIVPIETGLQRSGKSCRLRWLNHLRPDLKTEKFSKQEEQLIIDLRDLLGNRWSQIAAYLPGRTDNDVKNFWNSLAKKNLQLNAPCVYIKSHHKLHQAEAVSSRSSVLTNKSKDLCEASPRFSGCLLPSLESKVSPLYGHKFFSNFERKAILHNSAMDTYSSCRDGFKHFETGIQKNSPTLLSYEVKDCICPRPEAADLQMCSDFHLANTSSTRNIGFQNLLDSEAYINKGSEANSMSGTLDHLAVALQSHAHMSCISLSETERSDYGSFNAFGTTFCGKNRNVSSFGRECIMNCASISCVTMPAGRSVDTSYSGRAEYFCDGSRSEFSTEIYEKLKTEAQVSQKTDT
ncbi:hypothetical protein O6H91_04G081300 [Diphasiastrum complanatum]|uniref:Uncharacterized protein n=1 Tax=Diphasiastrum complanatum TaxID=34168 RepID=A0ACC2DYW6_DIPCM|nr:hypothetical protein O6H91_04G081300 [Diphasiastrum complanatum]